MPPAKCWRKTIAEKQVQTPRCGVRAAENQVRLQLFVLAYNLGNFLRQAMRHWTLTTLREKLIKIGAKVVRHSRKIVFQMAEVAVPRELFRAILEGIGRLRLPAAATG